MGGKKKNNHHNKHRKSSVASMTGSMVDSGFGRTESGNTDTSEEIHLPDELPDDDNVLIMEAPHQIAERARVSSPCPLSRPTNADRVKVSERDGRD